MTCCFCQRSLWEEDEWRYTDSKDIACVECLEEQSLMDERERQDSGWDPEEERDESR